ELRLAARVERGRLGVVAALGELLAELHLCLGETGQQRDLVARRRISARRETARQRVRSATQLVAGVQAALHRLEARGDQLDGLLAEGPLALLLALVRTGDDGAVGRIERR